VTSVLSLGGGINSTAMLIELCNRDMFPDLILFADTGGELPATYEHVATMEALCKQRGILFHTVTNAGRGQGDSLEENCLKRKELPSLAYGFKGCSVTHPFTLTRKASDSAQRASVSGKSNGETKGEEADSRSRKQPPSRYPDSPPSPEPGLGGRCG
jgi:hypothetical protein